MSQRLNLPSPRAASIGYVLLVVAFGQLIILLDWPNQLMLITILPILSATFYYPRWIYILMLIVSAGVAIWVAAYLSSSFSSSLQTIGISFLTIGGLGELMHKLISEREQAEAALRESEERLRAVAQTAFDAIVSTDSKGEIVFWNPAAQSMFGYCEDEILGCPLIQLVPKTYEQAYLRIIRHLQLSDTQSLIGRTLEWKGLRKSGGTFPIEVSVATRKTADDSFFTIVIRDISERKRTEQALQQYTEELETRNAELDAFAHTVAHDLKNPLAGLVTTSRLLETYWDRISEEKRVHYLEAIGQSGGKMSNIIDELLLLASVRQKEDIDLTPLDMSAIVRGAKQRLNHMIEEYQAEIYVPEIWPAALGYGPWIEEVWVNFISNAIKYGGQPPRVELGATDDPNDQVCFWVQDNGAGLTVEQQAQLFTPFERLDQVRAEGHGLGLSIVQRIVQKLGGKVGVESAAAPGQGSFFFFTLPETEKSGTP